MPGFIASEPIKELKDIQKAYQFSSWIGDFTQKSKCTGVELFVYPREHWDAIASFTLQLKQETGEPLTYGPVLKTQLVDHFGPEKYTKDGNEGYKITLDFSMFKGLDIKNIQLGDKITITGKLNEIPRRSWDQVTPCNKNECEFSKVYIPYKEPRTCTLLDQKEFMPQYSIKKYRNAFQQLHPTIIRNVPSLVNGDKVMFDIVYPSLICIIEDPLMLATIKKYDLKITKGNKNEFIKLTDSQMNADKIEFKFHTDKIVTKVEESTDNLPGPIQWFARLGGWLRSGDGSLTYKHEYNASVAGLLPGNQVEIIVDVDPRSLPPEEQIEKGNRISIFNQTI
ncbi:hypothetical protein ACT7DB_17325 [Bacillus cereus]